MAKQVQRIDRVFHALADPTRRAVIRRLLDRPASVSELARPFDMALPSFVQHIRVLEQSGLLRTEKAGRVRTCYVTDGALGEAEEWISTTRRLWNSRFDRLGRYLEELSNE
jgi:DNA-binding transcriptional ArsR family regulator